MFSSQTKEEFKQSLQSAQPFRASTSGRLQKKLSDIDAEMEQESKQIFQERMSKQRKIEDTRKTL